MLINSSSSIFPSSLLICQVNGSVYPIVFTCYDDLRNTVHYTLLTFINLLLVLPLSTLVLWMGLQQWRCKSQTPGQTSHTDVFTYCMAVLEVLNVSGMVFYSGGIFVCSLPEMVLGYFCVCIGSSAQTLFHSLTCVERYLAVVHPILYMRLKQSNGVRIRNISIVCALLLSFGTVGIVVEFFPVFPIIMYFSILAFIVMMVCCCSLAVFCVLIRSGLRSDQTKWRAFYTIVAITGALLLRFCGQVLSINVLKAKIGIKLNECNIFMFGYWMCLPSSMVLPLLFLHRNGKLTCWKHNMK